MAVIRDQSGMELAQLIAQIMQPLQGARRKKKKDEASAQAAEQKFLREKAESDREYELEKRKVDLEERYKGEMIQTSLANRSWSEVERATKLNKLEFDSQFYSDLGKDAKTKNVAEQIVIRNAAAGSPMSRDQAVTLAEAGWGNYTRIIERDRRVRDIEEESNATDIDLARERINKLKIDQDKILHDMAQPDYTGTAGFVQSYNERLSRVDRTLMEVRAKEAHFATVMEQQPPTSGIMNRPNTTYVKAKRAKEQFAAEIAVLEEERQKVIDDNASFIVKRLGSLGIALDPQTGAMSDLSPPVGDEALLDAYMSEILSSGGSSSDMTDEGFEEYKRKLSQGMIAR